MNHYYALLDRGGALRVSLPTASHGTFVDRESGEISGLRGAESMWNGLPPPWCDSIIEVCSTLPWAEVPDEDKRTLWRADAETATK